MAFSRPPELANENYEITRTQGKLQKKKKKQPAADM